MGQLSCGITIPAVTEKDGRYYKIVRNKWLPLSRIDEGVPALFKKLHELDPLRPGNVGGLLNLYRAIGMDHLKPASKKDYLNILKRLDHHFGHMPLTALKANHIAHFRETRRRAGKGGIRVNREVAVLSAAYEMGMREMVVDMNPCRGGRRNRESPSKRYVKNDEFLSVFERANDPFQDLIAAAYLSGVRQTDIVAWSRTKHIKPEGIVYTQSKTGKEHTVEWSKALQFFVERALNRFPDIDLIFANTRGEQWTTSGIASQLARLKSQWCFKNLRSKAQSDAPHSVLGHGAKLEELYRKMLKTKPVR
jgi:hypothetical protein